MNTAFPACPLLTASFIFCASVWIALSQVTSPSLPFSRIIGFW